MSRRMYAPLPILALTITAALAMATPAAAATTRFSCRADAVQGSLVSPAGTFDSGALSGTPCADASRTSSKSQTSGPLTVGGAGAFTHSPGRREAPGAAALASVKGFQVSGSGDQVTIAAAQANASYACIGGSVHNGGDSTVTGLVIDGKPVSLTNASTTERLAVDAHGSYVLLNHSDFTPTSLQHTAAFVHIVGTGDFTVAQASVAQSPGACAKTTGFPPALDPCPAGSSYDPASQRCLITAFTKRPIVVSAPYRGPVGVVVYALRHAFAVTGSRRCLHGHGSEYVMVGAPSGGGLIVGTSGADRIVTLTGNFTIDGNGGRDCISAGTGNNSISDRNASVKVFGGSGSTTIDLGNGNDRVILGAGRAAVKLGHGNDLIIGGPGHELIKAGNGNDRVLLKGPGFNAVTLGNGNDFVRGGAGVEQITVGNGKDTITGGPGVEGIRAGTGRDTILAGPGLERITAGTGADRIRSGPGIDLITAHGGGAQVTCIDHARVSVPAAAAGFAKAHGCKPVVVI